MSPSSRSDTTVTVGPVPGRATAALAVAILPGVLIAFGICAAAGIRDMDNAGLAVGVGVVAAVTVLLWLGCRVRFTPDALVVRRMWLGRKIPWRTIAHCEFFTQPAAYGEQNDSSTNEWLSVRLVDGRRIALLPISGGLNSDVTTKTALGRRAQRLMAIALAQLHARGVTLGAVSLADTRTVRSLWERTGLDPDTTSDAALISRQHRSERSETNTVG